MSKTEKLVVPAMGESITEAVVGQWLKGVGEAVSADEPVLSLETDKINVDILAPAAGALAERSAGEGDTVRVGDVVGLIDTEAKGAVKEKATEPAQVANGVKEKESPDTPEAAAETKTPPAQTSSSAPTSRDNLSKEKLSQLTPAQRRIARIEGVIPQAALGSAGAVSETVKMSPLRKRIAERLVQAQHESASLTTFNEIDMSQIMALRSRYKQEFIDRYDVKLGFMSFFVKACAEAAKLWPGLNAEMHEDAIVYKKNYDFGIAVSTPKGLVVPVLRGVDELSFADIEKGIIELAVRARKGKLTLDELVGGTFTITNGGIYGSMLSTPLLNYPQTGILGMHNIVKRPVVVGDSIEVRPVMLLALTYDHRVVDGREAVSFLVSVKESLENPERLLLSI